VYKKITKWQKFGKMNDLRQVNKMLISNIIFVFARECYLHTHYFKFIPQNP